MRRTGSHDGPPMAKRKKMGSLSIRENLKVLLKENKGRHGGLSDHI